MRVSHRSFLAILSILMLVGLAGCEAIAAQFTSPAERYRQEGDRLLADGRMAEAITSYRSALQSDPANRAAVKSLAALYTGQGRRRLALRLLRNSARLSPQDPEISQAIQQIQQTLPAFQTLPLRWQTTSGDSEAIGFTADSDRIYISMNDGNILAVTEDTGTVLWKNQLGSEATSAPAVSGDRLFVGAQDGTLSALSTQDGTRLWTFTTRAPIYAPPTLNAGVAYLASGDGTLTALDAAQGSLIWSFATGGALHAPPTLADGILYFGSGDSRLYAVDATSGKPAWPVGILTQGPVESQPLVAAGRVFFGSGDSRVYCLAAASGGEYWRYSTPDAVYAAPLLQDNRLIVASAGGTLTALDPISGKKTWEVRAGSALPNPPALASGKLFYAASADPNLYAVSLQDGGSILKFDTGDWISGAPLIQGNSLYLLGKDGTLLSFALPVQ